MNKKGFVFVETIVAVVILTSSLLLLYSTFTNILQSEKTRIYYDDINYVYRTYFLKKLVFNGEVHQALEGSNFSDNTNVYISSIGSDTLYPTPSDDKTFFNNMWSDFEVRNMYIVKVDGLRNLKACNESCAYKGTCKYSNMQTNCQALYSKSNNDIIKYLKSIYYVGEAKYLLIVEYESCDANNVCRTYYSWISVENI